MSILLPLLLTMKKIASLTMSIMFLFQGMARDMDLCEQIEKFSNFVSHYQDHEKFHGDSFFEYVVEDYLSSKIDNDDHHPGSNKKQSPTHANHQCCHPLVFVTPTSIFAIGLLKFETQQRFDNSTFQIKLNIR